jgi:Flp pilus assembly protein CpaB
LSHEILLSRGRRLSFAAERNMGGTDKRGAIHPAGVGEPITRGKIASETGRSCVWPRRRVAVRIGKVKSRSR